MLNQVQCEQSIVDFIIATRSLKQRFKNLTSYFVTVLLFLHYWFSNLIVFNDKLALLLFLYYFKLCVI